MAEVLRKIDAGESLEALGTQYGVGQEQLQSWIKNRDKILSPSPEGGASAGSSTGSAGGIGAIASALGATPSAPETGSRKAPEPVETISGEQIMLLIRAMDGTAMKLMAGARASHVPLTVQLDVMKIPQDDLDAMTMLAPYAAEYAPSVMKYMKPAMAGLFVGVWAMSCVSRIKLLSQLEKNAVAQLDTKHAEKKGPKASK